MGSTNPSDIKSHKIKNAPQQKIVTNKYKILKFSCKNLQLFSKISLVKSNSNLALNSSRYNYEFIIICVLKRILDVLYCRHYVHYSV